MIILGNCLFSLAKHSDISTVQASAPMFRLVMIAVHPGRSLSGVSLSTRFREISILSLSQKKKKRVAFKG